MEDLGSDGHHWGVHRCEIPKCTWLVEQGGVWLNNAECLRQLDSGRRPVPQSLELPPTLFDLAARTTMFYNVEISMTELPSDVPPRCSALRCSVFTILPFYSWRPLHPNSRAAAGCPRSWIPCLRGQTPAGSIKESSICETVFTTSSYTGV